MRKVKFGLMFLVCLAAGLAAEAGVFTPASIPGIRMWLDVDSLTGYTNSQRVHYWHDSSTNNVDAGTYHSRYKNAPHRSPRYLLNTVGGRPALYVNPYEADGDARDGMLTHPLFATGGVHLAFSQPGTVVQVYKRADTNTTYSSNGTWMFGTNDTVANLYHHLNGLRNSRSPYQYFISLAQQQHVWNADAITMAGTNVTSYYYRNGAQAATGTLATPGGNLLGYLGLAISLNGGVSAPVWFAEWILHSRVLNSAELNAIHFYVEMKYGINNAAAGVMLTAVHPATNYASGGTLTRTGLEVDVPNATRGSIQVDPSLTTGEPLTLYLDLLSTSGPLDVPAFKTWLEGLSNGGQFYTVQDGKGALDLAVTFSSVTSAVPIFFHWDTQSSTIHVDRLSLGIPRGTVIYLH